MQRLTKIQVTAAIFLIQDMRRNFLPKFIDIFLETPCADAHPAVQMSTNMAARN